MGGLVLIRQGMKSVALLRASAVNYYSSLGVPILSSGECDIK